MFPSVTLTIRWWQKDIVISHQSYHFNMANLSRRMVNDPLDGLDDKQEETILGFSPEFDTFPIVLAVFIVMLNSFVLFLTTRIRCLRTVTNLILSSLAFSDLLSGVLGIPFYLACSAIQKTMVCGITQMLTKFFSISIVLHLLLVSVDRHVAVIHAMRYSSLITKRRILSLILSAWLTAIFVALIQLSWIGLDMNVNEGTEEETARIIIIYDIFCIVLFFLVPLITMIFCYITIFLVLRKQLRVIEQNNTPSFRKHVQRSSARERRAAVIFAIMISIYIFCWLPYFLLGLQHLIGNDYFTLPISVEYILFYYPKFLNSLLNPLLYVFCKHDFRQAFRVLRRKTNKGSSLRLQKAYGKGSHRGQNRPEAIV